MKQSIYTDKSPHPAGPYSQGIQIGNRVYVAGQTPRQVPDGAVPDGIRAQTALTLENIRNILDAAGCTLHDVVKVTAHLAALDDLAEFNAVYRTYFEEPYPVRTTVTSGLNKVLVEIDVIAEFGED